MSDERRFKSEDRSSAMRNYVLTALAAIALAGTANARSPELVTETVSFADLDLTNAEGIATLESRISAAAKKVCKRAFTYDLQSGAEFEACKKAAIADAVEQVAALDTANRALFAGR
jgi:UrcA family protein